MTLLSTNLDRFPPQDEERLGSLCQESCEFVDQNVLDLIGLLYPYADSHTVDTRLDEHPFILITRNSKGIQEDFWRACGLNFWNVVSF